MSGGPPSWVDTGGDDGGSASSGGYGGDGYGGGNGSSSSSPWANGDFDASSFGAITYSHTDRGERIGHFVRKSKNLLYISSSIKTILISTDNK